AKRGDFRVSGLDISETFLRIARENAQRAEVQVEFSLGNASAMPYPDASFDRVICQAAFKSFSEPLGALNEMWRVLAPGGVAIVQDLRKEATMREISDEIRKMDQSWFGAQWTRWTFRFLLLRNAYSEPAM